MNNNILSSSFRQRLRALSSLVLVTFVYHSINAEPGKPSVNSTEIVISKPENMSSIPNRDLTVYMKDAGWCWYQDPRVIVHQGILYMGSVKGNGKGEAYVGAYDLKAQKQCGQMVVHPHSGKDDHNSPVFFARPDGRVLTMYALHHVNPFHYYRLNELGHPMQWGKEVSFKHQYDKAGKVTYSNLYAMEDEGKLYNFFRGIDYNPTFITSTDWGSTWGEPTHFIASELSGTQRPYCRYAGNGKNTINISFTDGHPRNFGNSIYYAEFRQGKFYKVNGTLIKGLKESGPLRPSESDLVYKGSGKMGHGKHGKSAEGSAWTSSLALDPQRRPHIAYTLYHSNRDHRYRLASWTGETWTDREVAFAGNCLYDNESSYTGLITLDPIDPTVVFISTDVDPSTGKTTGGKHEIYRAIIGPADHISTIRWESVTQNSTVRNLRPIVLREGDERILLWNRGRYDTFVNYDLETVGFVEKVSQTK